MKFISALVLFVCLGAIVGHLTAPSTAKSEHDLRLTLVSHGYTCAIVGKPEKDCLKEVEDILYRDVKK